MSRFLPLALVGLIGLMLYVMLGREDRDVLASVYLDKPAPAFSVPRLGDPAAVVTEADLKGDGPVVLNFWATWCGPCIAEHPKLMELSRLPGVRVIGINYDNAQYRSSPEKALAFLRRRGDPFALAGHEEGAGAWIEFGVQALPESFVIAGDGTILYKHTGPINPGDLEEKFLPAIEAARARDR